MVLLYYPERRELLGRAGEQNILAKESARFMFEHYTEPKIYLSR